MYLTVVRLPGYGTVVCLLAPSPSSSPRSSRWLVHARTRGGKPSPLRALYRTRAHPGALMHRSEHAGKLNAAPPLWCFSVMRAAPRKPTKAPPLTMLSSVESAQGRIVTFSVPPRARRRGFPLRHTYAGANQTTAGQAVPDRAPPFSRWCPATLSRHRLVVARPRVHQFAAVCPGTFTRMHSLASGLPRRHGYPSCNAAELEPHQAVTAAPLLGIGHPNFDADLLCSTATSLSLPPLLP
jgi:hypothetical protein